MSRPEFDSRLSISVIICVLLADLLVRHWQNIGLKTERTILTAEQIEDL